MNQNEIKTSSTLTFLKEFYSEEADFTFKGIGDSEEEALKDLLHNLKSHFRSTCASVKHAKSRIQTIESKINADVATLNELTTILSQHSESEFANALLLDLENLENKELPTHETL